MNAKKVLSIFSMLLVVISACSQVPSGYKIKGNIEGLADGTVLELLPGATHKEEKAVATCKTTAGKFEFKGSVKEPRLFIIMAKDSYGSIKVMVENGTITVTGKVSYKENNGEKNYNFSSVKVEGSPSHKLYLKKMAPRRMVDSLFDANQTRHAKILKEMAVARNNKDKALYDSLSKTEAAKQYAKDDKLFFETVENTFNSAVLADKDSWWGPFMMLCYTSYLTEENRPMYDAFSPEVKNSYYGQLVKNELYPVGMVGSKAPVLKLVDNNNKTVSTTELMKGKKYTLIDFWASWCNPCRKEIPNLKALYEKYASKGLQIISISIDKKEADWQKALGEEKLPWPNFRDNNKVGAATTYGVQFIPAMFLIDEKGVLVGDKLRGKALEDKLNELFK